jgi:hypothetical protein
MIVAYINKFLIYRTDVPAERLYNMYRRNVSTICIGGTSLLLNIES